MSQTFHAMNPSPENIIINVNRTFSENVICVLQFFSDNFSVFIHITIVDKVYKIILYNLFTNKTK